MLAHQRILFVAEAVTLAHAARPVVLAAQLAPLAAEVALAWSPRYARLFAEVPERTYGLHSIESEAFMAALAAGRPIYDAATLEDYVAEDLRVLDDFRPDVVVGDFRLSLGVSARLRAIPYVTIANAYWSPDSTAEVPVPDLPFARLLGLRAAQKVFNLVRPFAFALHARPLNQVRRRHGLPNLPWDMRYAYTDADCVLYADIPRLVDPVVVDARRRVLGPVLWSPGVALPAWWHELPAAAECVFVTPGSSGEATLVPRLVAVLARLPVTVLVATAGRVRLDAVPANVRVADFLPGAEAAARSRLVVCNGGSPTTQQALAVGTPVLGVCTNLDQILNMETVVRAGAGIALRGSGTGEAPLEAAVAALLSDARYCASAQAVSREVRALDSTRVLVETLDSL